MKKRALSLFLALILCLGLLPLTAAAAGETVASGYCGADEDGKNLSWTLTDDGTLTISGTGKMKNYNSNSSPWLEYNQKITTVAIQEGVTTIGYNAFEDCSALTSVTLPEGLTTIDNGAFEYCNVLTNVTLPKGLTTIGDYAFAHCAALTGVTFPESLTTIDGYAFADCTALTGVTFPESLTTINYFAFSDCTALTDVTFSEGLTTIGDYAFWGCTDLTSVTFPKSLTTIGDDAFGVCTALTDVTFSEGLTTIGDRAFRQCDALTNVTFPDSLTTIGDIAFYECAALTSVTIPAGVTTIGDAPFRDCKALTRITVAEGNPAYIAEDGVLFNKDKTTLIQYLIANPRTVYKIPDGVTTIGDYAFYNCKALTDVTFPAGLETIGDSAFWFSALTDVTFPEELTTIGTDAFHGCALTDVTLPASLTTVGNHAFEYCNALTGFTVAEDNISYAAVDGVLFNKEKTVLLKYPAANPRATYEIPDSVTTIGYYAFEHCNALTSVRFFGDVPRTDQAPFIFCTLTAYYPQGNATWTEEARAKLAENADVTWVPFDAGPSRPATYTVTVAAAQHGKVTASPKEGTAGTKVTLTVTPDKGYGLDTLTVKQSNGTAVKVTDNTFTMPAADVTVTPTFKELPPETYTVTVSNAQHGKVTASPNKGAAGTKVKLTITPDKDYELDTLTVKQANGTAVKVTDNTFTMPASNVTVSATFKALPVDRLSLNRSSVSVSVGSSVAVSATVSGYAGKHVYAISSDASVATVLVSDKTVRVKGVAQGSASVYVVMADTTAMTLGQAKADPSMKELKVTVTKAGTSGGGGSTGGGGSSGGGGGASGGSSGGSTSTTPTTPEPTTPASQTFGDVEKGSWYESGVTFVVSKGLFNGVGANQFAPQQNMTRAMLMTVLARLDGQETDGGATWYSKGMDWAKAQGISDGTNPEGNITREQLVTMLYRYANSPAVDAAMGMAGFEDVSAISDWAQDAMRWAVQNGILTGKGDARLDPQGLATRAEVATILQRYVEKLGQ